MESSNSLLARISDNWSGKWGDDLSSWSNVLMQLFVAMSRSHQRMSVGIVGDRLAQHGHFNTS